MVQNEEAATLCTSVGRVYIDLKGFFMGIPRPLLYELEGLFGVAPGVTAAMGVLQSWAAAARQPP